MAESPGSRDTDRETVAVLRLVDRLQSALRAEQRAAVVDTARQLIERQAPMAGQWLPLAMIAARNGEITLAREAFELYRESFPDQPGVAYRKVDLLVQIGAWNEVLGLLQAWPADWSKPASYAYTRGAAALYLGEREEARQFLEESVRLHPNVGAPWLSIALLVDFSRETELAELLIAAERSMANATPVERGNYYYALGKAYADRGEHARAFAAYAQGAGAMKSQLPYSREEDRRSAAEAVSGYDPQSVAALARQQRAATDRAIFVMGLPRSGTTLIEQILTSHSAVVDGAEIYRLGLLAKDIGGVSRSAVDQYVERQGTEEAARLWQHWLDQRFPQAGRVVDKTLNTSRMLGVAATLLPDAPLIWLTRDPLDCAWSCFRTRFAGEGPWSYDLEDIAFHFRLEDELLAQWRQILGERLLVVPFEALATESEPWIRRIIAHCGLAEEPQVFKPHENRRPVTTASALQVRRPINRAGIGAADPYREFLAPFIDAYYG